MSSAAYALSTMADAADAVETGAGTVTGAVEGARAAPLGNVFDWMRTTF